jgi:hypothetical protein
VVITYGIIYKWHTNLETKSNRLELVIHKRLDRRASPATMRSLPLELITTKRELIHRSPLQNELLSLLFYRDAYGAG